MYLYLFVLWLVCHEELRSNNLRDIVVHPVFLAALLLFSGGLYTLSELSGA